MSEFTVGQLGPETWEAFADLVERNGGIFGGCWCIGFHAERGQRGIDHREAKKARVFTDRAHAAPVFDSEGKAQGWCQYGSVEELPKIKHRVQYEKEPPQVPTWRTACCFVDKHHRGQGILRLAVGGALEQIARRGGGLVETIAETVTGREAHGRFLFTGTAELFEDHGFHRVRQVGKHAWILNKQVEPAPLAEAA